MDPVRHRLTYMIRSRPLRAVLVFSAIGLACTLGYALGLTAALGLGGLLSAAQAQPGRPSFEAAAPRPDASRFILNALLVPALDGDAVPLRFVDPRPAMHCGRRSAVRVNGEMLRPGALVPDAPFELEWWTDGCRPFGAAGPRFEGGVKLVVFREDWGFSAVVEPLGGPAGLRIASTSDTVAVRPAGASFPLCPDAAGRSASCLTAGAL